MALLRQKLYTLDEFKEFITQPENEDQLFELIDGEIFEVSPGRTSNSQIGLIIAAIVFRFCQDNNMVCYFSGADGTYSIQGHVVAPDFAYKTTPMNDEYPDPDPPLWAVEIVSPTDKAPDIRKKRQIYIQAGILYWEIYPEAQSIDVYKPGQSTQTVGIDGTLDGGSVLAGFSLLVKTLFPDK